MKRIFSALLALALCVGAVHAAPADTGEDETYLISITTSDGVVSSGYRGQWRWVALTRADPGRPGILLYDSWGNHDVLSGLKRSDGLLPGSALADWGKGQDGKPATLTLGEESWECTARYSEYYDGQERVLYVDFPRDERTGYAIQPDSDTLTLFRYSWAQQETARCAGALDDLLHADGYVVDKQLAAPSSTVVLRHKEVPAAGGEAAYQDYELCLVPKRAYTSDPVHRLLLPSTTLVGDYAPTDRTPDFISLDHSGQTLTYVYSFDAPLARPDGEVLHEAGTYAYVVDTGTGELTASHRDSPWAARVDPQAEGLAWWLKNLELFLGNENGDFELERAPSRVEALVMLIRALGEEPQAKAAGKTHPFTDVPAWADGYVSWGYAQGYTNGVSDTRFGAELTAGADMYLTFMLRALGYSDKEGDFTWSSPWLAARAAGILPFETNCVNFTRSDAVLVTSAALFAYEKDQSRTLHERLEVAGTFSAEFFHALFPDPPFAWQTTVERKVNEALDKALEVGQTDRRTAQVQSHAILDVAQDGVLFTVNAMVCRYSLTDEALKAGDYGSYGFSPYVIEIQQARFSPGTVLRCEMAEGRDIWDDPQAQLFRDGLVTAAQGKMTDLIASGAVQFRAPTYDEAVAELRGGFTYNDRSEKTYETDECTVFVYDRGGAMHTGTGYIDIIYKPGSAKGDGFILNPPTSGSEHTPVIPRTPDHVALSEDKKTFTYSYHFDEPLLYEGRIFRAAGDFVYTVDLHSGEVTENVPAIPAEVNTYAASLERLLADYARNGRVVEKTIEAPLCSLIFHYFPAEDGTRSYGLDLVYKTDVDADVNGNIRHIPEGTVKDISLPVTNDGGDGKYTAVMYTARMPDSMALNEDDSTFTLTYDESRYGSPYTQTVYLKTGIYYGK